MRGEKNVSRKCNPPPVSGKPLKNLQGSRRAPIAKYLWQNGLEQFCSGKETRRRKIMPSSTAKRRTTSRRTSTNRANASQPRSKRIRMGNSKKSSRSKSRNGSSSKMRSGSTRSRAASTKKTTAPSRKRATSTRAGASRRISGSSRRSTGTRGKSAAARGGRGRSSQSGVTTTDHDEIRRWVEERDGTPSSVRGTERKGAEAGMLRIDFPGYSGGDTLEEIGWEDFFEKFDESKLAFLYDPDSRSRFNKFIRRRGKK